MSNHPLLTKTTIAIIAITILATTAIITGLDSGILAAAITAIAGLGGYTLGRATKPK